MVVIPFKLKSLITGSSIAYLSTVSHKGHPHIVPICFVLLDQNFYSLLDNKPKNVHPLKLKRVQNIISNPKVTLIVNHYEEGLSDIEGLIRPKINSGKVNAWHLYVIKIKPNLWQISRDELIEKINASGIGTSVHYIPVHMHSYYMLKYGYKPDDYPIAKRQAGGSAGSCCCCLISSGTTDAVGSSGTRN